MPAREDWVASLRPTSNLLTWRSQATQPRGLTSSYLSPIKFFGGKLNRGVAKKKLRDIFWEGNQYR